jgi:hypothetical protein
MRLALIAASLLAASTAEARPASRGVFTEAGIGATGFLGDAQTYSEVGPTDGVRAGEHLLSLLAIGDHLVASSHEATVPPPPEGEWYQLYRAHADGRLGFRADELGFFVEGGLGAAYISSNVLGKVGVTDPGERFSVAFDAGGGIEYQIENRHYAFGVAADWWLIPEFAALTGIEGRLYMRYTY